MNITDTNVIDFQVFRGTTLKHIEILATEGWRETR